MMSNWGGSSSNRRKGKEGYGSKGNVFHASSDTESVEGVVATMSKKTKDLHRTSFLMFIQKVTGVEVEAQMLNGTKYRGVFYTATPYHGKKFELALKGVTAVDSSGKAITDPSIEVAGSTVLLSFADLVTLTVSKKNIEENEAKQHEFETDSNVGRRTDLRELDGRDLQQVSNSWLAPETSTSLEPDEKSGGIGEWNQFEANKRLYNVQDTYDENFYTKKLDKSSLTKEQVRKADRVARSIENSTTNSIVLKEDRGQLEGEDFNEEDMFSGVQRGSSISNSATQANDKHKNKTGRGPSYQQPPGPQGVWKRGYNISSPASNNNNSIKRNANSPLAENKAVSNISTPNSSQQPTGGGSAWSSRASKDSASALLANSVGVVAETSGSDKKSESKAPLQPPGLQQDNCESDDEVPNISFFGNEDDSDDATEENNRLLQVERNADSKKGDVNEEINSVVAATVSSSKDEEKTEEAVKKTEPAVSKLRATATEWKPNPDAVSFVPQTMGGAPFEKKHSHGKGKGGGNSSKRQQGRNQNSMGSSHYVNHQQVPTSSNFALYPGQTMAYHGFGQLPPMPYMMPPPYPDHTHFNNYLFPHHHSGMSMYNPSGQVNVPVSFEQNGPETSEAKQDSTKSQSPTPNVSSEV